MPKCISIFYPAGAITSLLEFEMISNHYMHVHVHLIGAFSGNYRLHFIRSSYTFLFCFLFFVLLFSG